MFVAPLHSSTLAHWYLYLHNSSLSPLFDVHPDAPVSQNWKDSFLTGLEHSCLFVPLVSEAAIAAIKTVTPDDLRDDNVLLEYEHAIVLNKAKRVAVLPVLIGQRTRSKVSLISFSDFKSLTLTILQAVYGITQIWFWRIWRAPISRQRLALVDSYGWYSVCSWTSTVRSPLLGAGNHERHL